MVRLIDADSLLVELDEWEKTEENSERALGVVDAKVIACQMPTVEAIPIDFIVEFKEDYCNAKSEKCDIGIANALVELMLCWEDEQEGIEWRYDHERIPSKQQSVEAIPIEFIRNWILAQGYGRKQGWFITLPNFEKLIKDWEAEKKEEKKNV